MLTSSQAVGLCTQSLPWGHGSECTLGAHPVPDPLWMWGLQMSQMESQPWEDKF